MNTRGRKKAESVARKAFETSEEILASIGEGAISRESFSLPSLKTVGKFLLLVLVAVCSPQLYRLRNAASGFYEATTEILAEPYKCGQWECLLPSFRIEIKNSTMCNNTVCLDQSFKDSLISTACAPLYK